MPDRPDLREQLAAFLAGELDAADAAALQARIDSEAWVARQADEMADLAMRLADVDAVTPPPGFSDRLRAGLAAEIGHDLPPVGAPEAGALQAAGAAAADGWAPRGRGDGRRPPQRRGAGSPGRRRGGGGLGGRAQVALGVAAAVAVLALTTTVAPIFGGGDDTAGDTAEVAAQDANDAGRQEEAGRSPGDDAATEAPETDTQALEADAPTAGARTESASGGQATGGAAEDTAGTAGTADTADTAGTAAAPAPAAEPAVPAARPTQGAEAQGEAPAGMGGDDQGSAEVPEADAPHGGPSPGDGGAGGAPSEDGGAQGGATAAPEPEPQGGDGSAAILADPEEGQESGSGAAAGDEEGSPGASSESDAAAEDAPPPADGPVVVDLGEAEDASAAQRLSEDPAVTGLLGRPAEDGARLRPGYRDEILRAPAFSDGTEPGACLVQVLDAAGEDALPAGAARHVAEGSTRLDYAIVRSTGGEQLDHIDVWIVDASTCQVIAVMGG